MNATTAPQGGSPSSGPPGGGTPQDMSREQREILTVLLVPLFMSLLSVSIVNVVLPSIGASLNAGDAELQWVLAGYTLSFGVVLVPAGRAGDLFGRGQLFVLGVSLFGAASLLAGFAPNGGVLNVARLLMGLGSGLLNPQTVAMIQQYFQGPLRGRAFGMFGLVVGMSVAIGPVLGGTFVQLFGVDWGWRASFLVNVPISLLGVLAAYRLLPRSAWRPMGPSGVPLTTAELPVPDAAHGAGVTPRHGHTHQHRDLDPVGVILLAIATLLVILPFLQAARQPVLWALLPLGIVMLLVWVWWENRYSQRGKEPMVDLALFREPSFSLGTMIISIYFAGMPSIWVIVALFLQDGQGFSALAAGLVGLPSALMSAITSAIAGRLTARMGRPLVLYGLFGVQTGLVLTIVVVVLVESAGWSPWWLLLTLGVLGAGGGAVVSPNQTFTLERVPLRHAGSAGGVLQTGQRIGTAIGLAMITGVYFMALRMGGEGAAALSAFGAVALVVGLAGTISLYDVVRGKRGSRTTAA